MHTPRGQRERTAASALLVLAVLCSSGCSVFGIHNVEEPPYEILIADGTMEIRHYESVLLAQTAVKGGYEATTNVAFRTLADYIFGHNQQEQSIAMMAPVFQERDAEYWLMSFVLPSDYTVETLPTPADSSVAIQTIPDTTVATIRYSGFLNARTIAEHTKRLQQWLDTQGYQQRSVPRSAGYDPPWTLPFLRRNEIHIDVQ